MKRDSAKSAVLSRALKYVGRYKAYLWVSLFLSAVSVAATLYIPILTGQVIDLLIGQGLVSFSCDGSFARPHRNFDCVGCSGSVFHRHL